MIDYTEETVEFEENVALKILVDMFFQQFLSAAHFMCPLKLMELDKEHNFRKFLLYCLEKNLEEFHKFELENDADMMKKILKRNGVKS